jgi:hypothetical protein
MYWSAFRFKASVKNIRNRETESGRKQHIEQLEQWGFQEIFITFVPGIPEMAIRILIFETYNSFPPLGSFDSDRRIVIFASVASCCLRPNNQTNSYALSHVKQC